MDHSEEPVSRHPQCPPYDSHTRHLTSKHGFCQYPEYDIYRGMMSRCTNPRNTAYKNYGQRGITVCQRWQNFADWYADLCPRPKDHTLERIDNDAHYSCGQCQHCLDNGWSRNVVWATRAIQLRNTRRNHRITFNAITRCARDWDTALGFPAGTVSKRLHKGWSEERALTTPWHLQAIREITFNGITQSVTAWNQVFGFPKGTISNRLRKGWTVEDAFKTPLRVWPCSPRVRPIRLP